MAGQWTEQQAAVDIRRPVDLPALGPVYAAARRFMAENGNPTQWSDRYPLTEDLEEDIGKGQLYVWAPDGAVHGAFVLQLGEEANYREIQGPCEPSAH